MSTIGKSIGLGTAFLAGIAIAANAGSPGRADASGSGTIANPPSSSSPLSSSQPSLRLFHRPMRCQRQPPNATAGRRFRVQNRPAAFSSSGVGPRVSSFGTVRTEHSQVPEDFDANIAIHPYTSGIGPWPGPGTWGPLDKPPSHNNRRRPLLGSTQ
jgi:hypothetical protein